MNKTKVMIAGIGGASLGTEIQKSLVLAGGYEIYGCDISSTAYGLYDPGFVETFHISRDNYVDNVLESCRQAGIKIIIAGGEGPMLLLNESFARFQEEGISIVSNSPDVISLCSNKGATFEYLEENEIAAPRTIAISGRSDLDSVGLPCIVKPATNSGGSSSVFFAVDEDDAMVYAEYIRRSGSHPIAQEYIDDDEGEFTIGVLSFPDKSFSGSIALRRSLDAKLSVSYRGRGGIISSGYSQGYIGEYPDLCRQAEHIALTVGSRGPLNIQGRVRNGMLLPFEINPRFSASTYLRALAGFNEVDIFIRYIQTGLRQEPVTIRPGFYLRSLAEQYVAGEYLK